MKPNRAPNCPPGRIFVTAGPVGSGVLRGAVFRVAVDKSGLRLANLTLTGASLTMDTLLAAVGLQGASGLSDLFTISSPGVVYVPTVAGATGECRGRFSQHSSEHSGGRGERRQG